MTENAHSHHGRFVWYDLMTTDPKAARAFYTELFGWNVQEADMGPGGIYTMLKNGDTTFGGIAASPPGAPSSWVGYVHVDDLDATVSQATQLGGKVLMPIMPIPEVGRFAIIADPHGGVVGPITLKNPGTEPEGPPAAGSIVWRELWATQPEAAKAFYTALFGWKHHADEMPGFGTYTQWNRGGPQDFGGMMQAPPEVPVSAWVYYVKVDDIEATAKRAEKLGGKTMVPLTNIGDSGKFVVLQDPQQAVFASYTR